MVSEQNDLAAQNAALLAQQRAVADLGLLALSERSLPVLLQEAATLVRGALQTDFSKVLQLEPDEQLLVVAGSGWPEGVVGHLELPSSGGSPAAFALRTRSPAIITDLLNETRFTPEPALLDLGVRSSVNVISKVYGSRSACSKSTAAHRARTTRTRSPSSSSSPTSSAVRSSAKPPMRNASAS